jgi:hypothetical protein
MHENSYLKEASKLTETDKNETQDNQNNHISSFDKNNHKILVVSVCSAIIILVFTLFWMNDLISDLWLQILVGIVLIPPIILDFLNNQKDALINIKKRLIWSKFILTIASFVFIAFSYHYILGFFVYLFGG